MFPLLPPEINSARIVAGQQLCAHCPALVPRPPQVLELARRR